MTPTIRSLQTEHEQKFLRAQELLSKAEPSDAEKEEGLKLIGEIKEVKKKLDREWQVEDAKSDLEEVKRQREDPESSEALKFMRTGHAGNDGALLGMTAAGKCVIDSFGSTLLDEGPGNFGEKAWQAMQTRDYKRGFVSYLRKKGNERGVPASQWKAIQEGFDDQGGVFVPADMLMRIIGREPTPTRLAGMVTNITTARDRVVMPRKQYSADDLYSTAFRATWTGEIPASDTAADVDDTNLTGNIEVPVFTAMLSASLTNDMVEDSGFPIQSWIENELRIVVDLLKDNMILNGTGKGQPTGLLQTGVNRPTIITSGTSAGIAPDDLFEMAYSIPEQYDDNCSWGFNKTSTAKYIAKLKDANQRYLFGVGLQDSGVASARPKELIGYPFAYSGFYPNIGSSSIVASFGDFKGYYLVNRLGITIQVLRETKAKRNQFELVARVRFGGQPVEPWKIRLLKCGA